MFANPNTAETISKLKLIRRATTMTRTRSFRPPRLSRLKMIVIAIQRTIRMNNPFARSRIMRQPSSTTVSVDGFMIRFQLNTLSSQTPTTPNNEEKIVNKTVRRALTTKITVRRLIPPRAKLPSTSETAAPAALRAGVVCAAQLVPASTQNTAAATRARERVKYIKVFLRVMVMELRVFRVP